MSSSKPYHHGNLHEEILKEAIALGRQHGPQAVTIRAATRAVGVSPTAAYRHFADQAALLDAVADVSSNELISRLFEAAESTEGTVVDKMMATGFAYFEFGLEEPNFFECLITSRGFDVPAGLDAATVGSDSDRRIQALATFYGYMARYAREIGQDPKPEFMMANCLACWSSVHGFTVLCTTGNLAPLPREAKDRLAKAVIAASVRGLDFVDPSDPCRNYPTA
ncbi:TetR/AcrR family transcriptional regulator [Corynebacterium sp.]|uniref:TetR/AcrR family transcriptional regulator n=1 Tax=Corynebacterium sp. TaxID=1720 RepID=UPI0027BA7EF1|nr:TetR/AcrR family transcriptional regulator [Corynebacterium sp.]